MTCSYSSLVFTSKGVGTFLKLLLKWRGSIYKLVWKELLIYMMFYTILALTYRLALDEDAKKSFENVCLYCGSYGNQIPITFVLGFYVSLIITRWWNQFETIPWPDTVSLWVSTCIHGQDERGRLMRRTIVRYMNLSLLLVFRLISLPVKKRFPTLEHLLAAGILEPKEMELIAAMEKKANQRSFWMPLVWAGSIVIRARKEDRVKNDQTVQALISQINEFRNKAGRLLHYDWVPVPLVYTQVVTLAVYSYLGSCLLGRQFLDPSKKYPGHEVDFYVPIFSFLQFFFYMGWLKVAEALINPFGEDDDDFETNWIIDRNLCVSYLIVDEMHSDHPDLVKDQYWDEQYPELPYTAASEDTKGIDPCAGATAKVEVSEDMGLFVDDLQVVVTNDKGHLLDDELVAAKTTSSRGSQSTLNTLKATIGQNTSHPSFITKIGNVLGGSRTMLGSNLSIFNSRGRAQRRMSRISNRQVSNMSLAKGGDKSPDPTGQMFVFDRNFSYDAGLAKSETNINRVQTPPIPDPEFLNSPRVGRLWRRMSEPVNDLPKQRIKKRKPVYVRQQNVNNNNKDFLKKVEMLHSFTEDTLNALKQEQEQGGACKTDQDSTELLKILDDTHQQFRNNLLRGVHRSRQGSISSAGNRESPAHSDIDIDSDNKPKKFEQAKKMTEMKKPPEIKKLPEIKKASEAKKITQTPSTPIEDMLFFKIDRPAEDNHESLEKDLLDNDEEVHSPVASGLDLRESRSNPVLMELNQIKELEIIEEQNEQDNQSDSGECSSLLHEEVERQLDKKTT